jgi:hypothetical protein
MYVYEDKIKKMRNKTVFFLMSLMPFAFSCKEKDCIITNDTITNGKIIKRKINKCENDGIISEQEFVKNARGDMIPYGFYKDYYGNGKLKSLGFFKNGEQDSIANQYYENGRIKIRNYKSDKHFSGPQYYFSEYGKIEDIEFYNKNSEVWLKVSYNDKEKIKSIEGELANIMPDERRLVQGTLPIGDILPIIVEVPIVFNAKTVLNLTLRKSGLVLNDTIISSFVPVYNISVYPSAERLMKSGIYEYVANVSLLDSISGELIKRDSSVFRVNVSNVKR